MNTRSLVVLSVFGLASVGLGALVYVNLSDMKSFSESTQPMAASQRPPSGNFAPPSAPAAPSNQAFPTFQPSNPDSGAGAPTAFSRPNRESANVELTPERRRLVEAYESEASAIRKRQSDESRAQRQNRRNADPSNRENSREERRALRAAQQAELESLRQRHGITREEETAYRVSVMRERIAQRRTEQGQSAEVAAPAGQTLSPAIPPAQTSNEETFDAETDPGL